MYHDADEEEGIQGVSKPWRGITIFYHGIIDEDVRSTYYLDTPEGLVAMELIHEEWLNVCDTYATWKQSAQHAHDVLQLALKKNAKELDPTLFDKAERDLFNEADAAERRQWINNKVELVDEPTERTIPTSKSIARKRTRCGS